MSLRKTLKRGNKQAFIRLFIYLFISCIALYLCLNLNTPAKQTHWTRDKVDFCCYNPLDITVSSLEWDARLLQIPPPPAKFYDTSCLRKDRYITVSWSASRKCVRSNACKCSLFDHNPLSFLT